MPWPALAMGSGAGLGMQTGANIFTQATQNFFNARETWKASERQYQMSDWMYGKELEQWNRQNAYNLQMWNMQNAYNSPAAQMQRYKDAGLNPNLIYGQGQPGMASSMPQSPAPQMKGANVPQAKFSMAPVDVVSAIYDIKLKNQEISNMEAARQLTIKEQDIKSLDIIMKGLDAGLKPFQIQYLIDEMNQNRRTWPLDIQAKEEMINKTMQEINESKSKVHLNAAAAAQHRSSADLNASEKAKIDEWLEHWRTEGINIDKDQAVQRKVLQGFNSVAEGIMAIPDLWKSRQGSKAKWWPW